MMKFCRLFMSYTAEFLIPKNKVIVTSIILFILPFFWFRMNEIDIGGDGGRIYLHDPITWFKNLAIYPIHSLSPLGKNEPYNFAFIPFLIILEITKSILLDNVWFLNCVSNGTLLCGAFLFTCLSSYELLESTDENIKINSSIAAALLYVFSPVTYGTWIRALSPISLVAVYPLIFYLFLKAIKRNQVKYILIGAIVTFVFSLDFGFNASPHLFAFFIPIVPFLFLYSVFNKRGYVFVKHLLVFCGLLLLINAFHLIPEFAYVFLWKTDLGYATLTDVNRGLHYFCEQLQFYSLLFNLINQPLYACNSPYVKLLYQSGLFKYMFLSVIYPLTVSVFLLFNYNGLSRLEKKVFLLMVSFFLILLICISPHAYNMITRFFEKLFTYVPGFGMFRDPHGKFFYVYTFFYGLVLGFSLKGISGQFPRRAVRLLFLFIGITIIYNGWPFISGKIFYMPWGQSKGVKGSIEIPENYKLFLDKNERIKLDARYLGAPLDDCGHERLKGKHGGVYIGPPILSALTGKRIFAGLGMLQEFGPLFTKIVMEKRHDWFRVFLPIFNIGYAFHNTDDYIYDNFPAWPYSVPKNSYPDQTSIGDFLEDMGLKKKVFQVDDFILYTNNKSEDFLPHFHVAQDIMIFPGKSPEKELK